MHSTLARQIKKYLPGINPEDPQWKDFFKSVDDSYIHFDDDRRLISRSLDLSSKELVEVNERLAKEKARDDVILESIGEGLMVTSANGMTGSLSGRYYGPNAEEVGGVYNLGGTAGTMMGGFGGKR